MLSIQKSSFHQLSKGPQRACASASACSPSMERTIFGWKDDILSILKKLRNLSCSVWILWDFQPKKSSEDIPEYTTFSSVRLHVFGAGSTIANIFFAKKFIINQTFDREKHFKYTRYFGHHISKFWKKHQFYMFLSFVGLILDCKKWQSCCFSLL